MQERKRESRKELIRKDTQVSFITPSFLSEEVGGERGLKYLSPNRTS